METKVANRRFGLISVLRLLIPLGIARAPSAMLPRKAGDWSLFAGVLLALRFPPRRGRANHRVTYVRRSFQRGCRRTKLLRAGSHSGAGMARLPVVRRSPSPSGYHRRRT